MNRTEFLDGLRECLKGRVDDAELNRQLDYYNEYISNEMNNGRSEEDVLDELGNPRLIAKTIIQTYRLKDDPVSRHYSQSDNNRREDMDEPEKDSLANRIKKYTIIALIALGALTLVCIVFKLLALAVPIIILFVLFMWLLKLFGINDHNNPWRR